MRSSATASPNLSDRPGGLGVWASPVADSRRRVRGLLLDLGPAELAQLPGVADEIELLARRWRASTGSRPELHCVVTSGPGTLRLSALRELAPEGAVVRAARATSLHLWLASPLIDSPEVASIVWGAGASLGRLVGPGDGARMARGPLAVVAGQLGGVARPSFLGRTLVREVDDGGTARAARRARAWRVSGRAVGEPLPLDEWGWWVAGLGCRTSAHAPVQRTVHPTGPAR